MKKFRKNRGFTLIECVVAMAVLAIMTLGLLMILSVTVRQRNQNTQIERDVDNQVERLLQDSNTAIETISPAEGNIVFASGAPEVSTSEGEVTTAFEDPNKIVITGAHMVYFDDPDSDLQIGALQYGTVAETTTNPDETTATQDPEETATTPPVTTAPEIEEKDIKVYGSFKTLNDWVYVTELSATDNGGTTTAIWYISFKSAGGDKQYSAEKSIKVALDPNLTQLTPLALSGKCNLSKISRNVVRIEPQYNWVGSESDPADFLIQVTFTIPTSKYRNPSDYFGFGSTAIPMNKKPGN